MAEPKQERALKTREVILRSAAEVFDECGFSGASISKIMERAGVTQGGMYFHFKSKQGLALAVMNSQQDHVDIPAGEEGLQRIIDITFHVARELRRNVVFRAGVRLAVEQGEIGLQDATPYEQWVDQFYEQLLVARGRGELLAEVDEKEFAQVIVGAYSGTQLFSQIATGRQDLPQRVAALWRYLLPAVATTEAKARLRARAEDFEWDEA
ncbi:ScbR family autoregulator-binding transcription factor [Kitasatospora sp. NPDC101155]|uniref:ScbR family autoregulator-binding transcription factor n=1 Tax=Kitasatospora sp. NPDC101155 TaxID=3364097 RepID=UPI003803CEF4